MTQLPLLFGRVLTLPADADGSYTETDVDFIPVTIDLTPAQARWMGVSPPRHASCPGCVLFGCCAAHDVEASDAHP